MDAGPGRAHDRAMLDPLVTGNSLDLSTPHVIAVVLAALVIGTLGVVFRRALMATVDELIDLWREHGGTLTGALLDKRPNLPATPWYCARCLSHNERMTFHCYRCGATRDAFEAPVPDADVPAGPSAGRDQRTRRKG